MPAFLVTTSHWLGLKPWPATTEIRSGQPLSHAITSDLGNWLPDRPKRPLRARPAPVLDNGSRSGPAIGSLAMRNSSRTNVAYGSAIRKRIAILCSGVLFSLSSRTIWRMTQRSSS